MTRSKGKIMERVPGEKLGTLRSNDATATRTTIKK